MDLILGQLRLFGSLTSAMDAYNKDSSQDGLEGVTLEEYLNTYEAGSLWNNLKNEKAKDEEWER